MTEQLSTAQHRDYPQTAVNTQRRLFASNLSESTYLNSLFLQYLFLCLNHYNLKNKKSTLSLSWKIYHWNRETLPRKTFCCFQHRHAPSFHTQPMCSSYKRTGTFSSQGTCTCPGPSSKKLFSKETYLCHLILSGLGSDVILWGRPSTWYHTLSEVNSQFHHK